jgi:2-keto-4-pentenoate hydratase/2-oxohepta-3-ene-1,7-dioic acid hydratase in catechol pathway
VSKVAQREELDYEVELAIVIGRDCKDATLENALEHVVGYTCANDITARKHQAESSQWSFSKSASGTGNRADGRL